MLSWCYEIGNSVRPICAPGICVTGDGRKTMTHCSAAVISVLALFFFHTQTKETLSCCIWQELWSRGWIFLPSLLEPGLKSETALLFIYLFFFFYLHLIVKLPWGALCCRELKNSEVSVGDSSSCLTMVFLLFSQLSTHILNHLFHTKYLKALVVTGLYRTCIWEFDPPSERAPNARHASCTSCFPGSHLTGSANLCLFKANIFWWGSRCVSQ